ncbi:hypothetical protein [Acidiphilium acidophilum]|uniref:hypothetical protein n=1 Tax=Acidiphilium acidophilum TaxID=76588 RepID=UPI002E8E700C|nr:hypothetical protein [Acidiphilium acidophilum]
MKTAYHMVQYRRFEPDAETPNGATLEMLCRKALNTSKDGSPLSSRPDDRVFPVEGEGNRKILLNKVADLSSAVFGELCLIQTADLQALLSSKRTVVELSDLTTATIFELDERTAPDGTEFVRGMSYWLVIGNHLLFVKMQSMSVELLQSYFEWLLISAGGVVDAGTPVVINAAFDPAATVGGIGDIRSLRISGKSAPQVVRTTLDDEKGRAKTSRVVAEASALMDKAVPMMKAIFGDSRTDSLVDSLGPGEYLAVDASVKIRGERTEASSKALQAIANDLADASDAKVQIEGRDGRIVDGDAILRVRMPFHRPHEGSSLLEFDNVADQLQKVYKRFVDDGKIQA